MPQLYSISYRSKAIASTRNADGKVGTEEQLREPVVLTALPYSTAMAYSHLPDFTMTPYEFDDRSNNHSSKGASRAKPRETHDSAPAPKPKRAAPTRPSAAETGDLSAAINSK